METLERIIELMKVNNCGNKELTEALELDRQAVTDWKAGRSKSYKKYIYQIADFFDVPVDFLLNGEEARENIRKTKGEKVSVYGKIPAGIPMEAIEDIIDIEEISEEMTKGGKEYFALKISGDSMYPNYIDSDIVIFEKTSDCENGDDCAVMVNGCDATFKRVEKNENGVVLKPLNPIYDTYYYTNEQIKNLPVTICGVARELRRKKLK